MKRSIETRLIKSDTNETQHVSAYVGAELTGVQYGDNSTIELSFEGGDDGPQPEDRFFKVYDSRMTIPDEYFPLEHSVSDEGITLYIVEVKKDSVEKLIAFGNFMIAQLYSEWLDTPEANKDFDAWLRSRETTLADVEKWKLAKDSK